MKKLLLSMGVISIFILYSLFERKSSVANISQTPITSNTNNQLISTNPQPLSSKKQYKDGQYIGDVADAYYGNIQVQAIIAQGLITDVQFLQYPNDRSTSIMVNNMAMPILRQEAISAQNTNVDVVSGATDTSLAFISSLTSALSQAK